MVRITFLLNGLGYEHAFRVLEGGDLVILGNDFLRSHGAIISLGDDCHLQLPHCNLPKGELHTVKLRTASADEIEKGNHTSETVGSATLPNVAEGELGVFPPPPRIVVPDLSRLVRSEHLLFSEGALTVPSRTSKMFWLRMPKTTQHEGQAFITRIPRDSGLAIPVEVMSSMVAPNAEGFIPIWFTNNHYHDVTIPVRTPVALIETDTFNEVLEFGTTGTDGEGPESGRKTWASLTPAERTILEQASLDPDELLNSEQKTRLQNLLAEFVNVFAVNPKKPGTTHAVEAQFELKPGARPHRHPPSRLGDIGREIVEKEVAELEANGLIRKSNSPWASRLVLVRKKDGSARCCCDYRQLNEKLVTSDVPLPRCDEAMERLGGSVQGGEFDGNGLKTGGVWRPSRWFATMDLASGFWAIPIRESDKALTAFVHHRGKHEWNVLPMGVASGPETMVRMMETALTGLEWDVCMTFIDDLACAGAGSTDDEAFDNLLDRLRRILQRLLWSGLTAKASKCVFGATEVDFLGHRVGREGIRTDPKKVASLRDITADSIESLTQVRMFLGMAGYYRRFIPKYPELAGPLTELTKTKVGVTFPQATKTEAVRKSIEGLKEALTSAPVLAIPRGDRPFILKTDACSTHGLGGCLVQIQDDGHEQPIGFYGRRLQPAELKYTVTEQELLAVVACTKAFRPYLWGRKWVLITDHSALRWLHTMRETVDGGLSSRLTRWSLRLQEYNFEVQHKAGSKHHDADAISRLVAAVRLATGETDAIQRRRQERSVESLKSLLDSTLRKPTESAGIRAMTPKRRCVMIIPMARCAVGGGGPVGNTPATQTKIWVGHEVGTYLGGNLNANENTVELYRRLTTHLRGSAADTVPPLRTAGGNLSSGPTARSEVDKVTGDTIIIMPSRDGAVWGEPCRGGLWVEVHTHVSTLTDEIPELAEHLRRALSLMGVTVPRKESKTPGVAKWSEIKAMVFSKDQLNCRALKLDAQSEAAKLCRNRRRAEINQGNDEPGLRFVRAQRAMGNLVSLPGIHARDGDRPGLCAPGERTAYLDPRHRRRAGYAPIRFDKADVIHSGPAPDGPAAVDLTPNRQRAPMTVASTTPLRKRAEERARREKEESSVIGHYLDPSIPTTDALRSAQLDDEDCRLMVGWLERRTFPTSTPTAKSRWILREARNSSVKDGLLFHHYTNANNEEKLLPWIPPGCQETYLVAFHDRAGHMGEAKTYGLMKRRVYWPGMQAAVQTHVSQCHECTHAKAHPRVAGGTSRPSIGTYPFEVCVADILTMTMSAKGNSKLLVFMDPLSRWVEAVPFPTDPTAEECMKAFLTEVVCRHGAPRGVRSDNGSNLASTICRQIYDQTGVDLTTGTAKHPHGIVERFNSTLAGMCRATNEGGHLWDEHLPFLLFSYRAAPHRVTGYAPAEILYGRELRLPAQLVDHEPYEAEVNSAGVANYAHTLLRRIRAAWDEVILISRDAQTANEETTLMDRIRPHMKFEVGDEVLRRLFQRGETKRQNKLRYGWEGPYRVAEVLPRDVYVLTDLENRSTLDRFHVTDLRPYRTMVDEKELEADEHKVDKILGRKMHNGEPYYLVRWFGYSSKHDSWEPESGLKPRCGELLTDWQPQQVPREPAPKRTDVEPPPRPNEKCLYATDDGSWETCTIMDNQRLDEMNSPETLVAIRVTNTASEIRVPRKLLQPWARKKVGQPHPLMSEHRASPDEVLAARYDRGKWIYTVSEKTVRGTRRRDKAEALFTKKELTSETFVRVRETFNRQQEPMVQRTMVALLKLASPRTAKQNHRTWTNKPATQLIRKEDWQPHQPRPRIAETWHPG